MTRMRVAPRDYPGCEVLPGCIQLAELAGAVDQAAPMYELYRALCRFPPDVLCKLSD